MLRFVQKYDKIELKTGKTGIVRYIGSVDFADEQDDEDEIWYGIQLDKKCETGHDGTVGETVYFWCHHGHGLFVRPEDIVARYVPYDKSSTGVSRVPVEPDDLLPMNKFKGMVFDEPNLRSSDHNQLSLGVFGQRNHNYRFQNRSPNSSDAGYKKKSYSTPTTPVQQLEYNQVGWEDVDYGMQKNRNHRQMWMDEVMSEGDDEGVSWRKSPRNRKQARRRRKRKKDKKRQHMKSVSPLRSMHLKPIKNTNSNRNSPQQSPRDANADYEWDVDIGLIDEQRDSRGGRENRGGRSQKRQNKEQAELQQKRREALNGGNIRNQNSRQKESQMWVSNLTGEELVENLSIMNPQNDNVNIRGQSIFSASNEAQMLSTMKEDWAMDIPVKKSDNLDKARGLEQNDIQLITLRQERDAMKKKNEDLWKQLTAMEQVKAEKKVQDREENQAQVEKYMIKIVELEQKLSSENVESHMRLSETLRAHDKIESELSASRRENNELRKQLEHIRQSALERSSKIKKLQKNNEGAARQFNNAEKSVRERDQELADLHEQMVKLKKELKTKEDKFADEMNKKKQLLGLYNEKVTEERELVTQKSAELEQAKIEANQMSIQEAEAIQQVKSKEEEVKQRAEDLQRLDEDMELRVEENKQRDTVNTRTQSLILTMSQFQEEWREESKSPGLRRRSLLRKSNTSWRSLRPVIEYPMSPQMTKRTEEETKRFLEILRPDGRRPNEELLPKDSILLVVKLGSKSADEGITCSFRRDWGLVKVIRAAIAVWRDHFQQLQDTPRQHNWVMETDISELGILDIKKNVRLRILSGPSGIELKGGQLDKDLTDFPELKNNTKIILSKFVKRKNSDSSSHFGRSMTMSALI